VSKHPANIPASDAGALDHAAFRTALLDWFARSSRDLPWRRTLDPYHVWLSEIMLQQTQMDRAVAYFERFLARFPDIGALAGADDDEVLKLWEGLGYYSRARNLLRAARLVQAAHGGVFPATFDTVRALPGVGSYTAGAVMSVAYNADVTAVDANVERVLCRVLDLDECPAGPRVKRQIGRAHV
jgi:A/G-specific adenine glycosylase